MILLVISVAAFFLSKIAGAKSQSILVSQDVKIDEERIAQLGLYVGQPVEMYADAEQDKIVMCVDDKMGERVLIHDFISSPIYNVLKKKPIGANIMSIYGYLVVVEIKFRDAL